MTTRYAVQFDGSDGQIIGLPYRMAYDLLKVGAESRGLKGSVLISGTHVVVATGKASGVQHLARMFEVTESTVNAIIASEV